MVSFSSLRWRAIGGLLRSEGSLVSDVRYTLYAGDRMEWNHPREDWMTLVSIPFGPAFQPIAQVVRDDASTMPSLIVYHTCTVTQVQV